MTSWAISPEVIKVDSKETQSNIAFNESQNTTVRTACGSGWLISNYDGSAISEINRPLPQVVLTKPNLIQKYAVNSERQAINCFISRHDQITFRTEGETNEIH